MLKQLTENDTLYFIIKESEKLIPYYSCFPKLTGQYLKVLLQHWGTSEDKVRVIAFINIRKLALISPSPFIDLCLKVRYMKWLCVILVTLLKKSLKNYYFIRAFIRHLFDVVKKLRFLQ